MGTIFEGSTAGADPAAICGAGWHFAPSRPYHNCTQKRQTDTDNVKTYENTYIKKKNIYIYIYVRKKKTYIHTHTYVRV